MKKLITLAALVLFAGTAMGKSRVIDAQPNSSDVLEISITSDSVLKSISNDITAAGETNSFTITADVVFKAAGVATSTNTFTVATAVADQVAGAETDSFYNYDNDSATGNTILLKAGDKLKLTGNDGSQTAYSNVYYRVVLETL